MRPTETLISKKVVCDYKIPIPYKSRFSLEETSFFFIPRQKEDFTAGGVFTFRPVVKVLEGVGGLEGGGTSSKEVPPPAQNTSIL